MFQMICQFQVKPRTRKPTPVVRGRKGEQGTHGSLIQVTNPLMRGCKITACICHVLESRFSCFHHGISLAYQPYKVGHSIAPAYRWANWNRQLRQLAENHAVPRDDLNPGTLASGSVSLTTAQPLIHYEQDVDKGQRKGLLEKERSGGVGR